MAANQTIADRVFKVLYQHLRLPTNQHIKMLVRLEVLNLLQ